MAFCSASHFQYSLMSPSKPSRSLPLTSPSGPSPPRVTPASNKGASKPNQIMRRITCLPGA